MGVILKNTAQSINIKERMDFSCALFNKNGELVANAPHIPIHLGAMSDTIKFLIREHYDIFDVWPIDGEREFDNPFKGRIRFRLLFWFAQ